MVDLAPGFYLARVYGSKAYRPMFPWLIRHFDGQNWQELGREGNRQFPACKETHSGLIGPLEEPSENGMLLNMWEDRDFGFYWFLWPEGCRSEAHWDMAEFKQNWDGGNNGYWIWLGSDEALTDNDMRGRPISGPVVLPGTGGTGEN
jgi:hypothetical protein